MDLFSVGGLFVLAGGALLALVHLGRARRRKSRCPGATDALCRQDQAVTVISWDEGHTAPPAVRISRELSDPAPDSPPAPGDVWAGDIPEEEPTEALSGPSLLLFLRSGD